MNAPVTLNAAPGDDATNGLAGPALGPAAFARIARIAYREAGLAISEGKSAMVRTRLARRLRALGLTSYEAYCDRVESPEGRDEIGLMVSALTTNVSAFFRESHHFDILRTDVLPALVAKAKAGGRVRIWSAGCSNGQEPYSIAATLLEVGMPPDSDMRVLATDIDPNVVAFARAGRYPETMVSGLPEAMRAKYFAALPGPGEPSWEAGPTLKAPVAFRVLNLLEPWPMRGKFDAIFCRNVVIYFDAETQDRLWTRFADQLAPGGWLFLGHSERLSVGAKPLFEGRGITTYRKRDAASAGAPRDRLTGGS